MLVYLVMAIDFPPWAIKAMDRFRRAFLWRGRKEEKGGLVLWHRARHVIHLSWEAWGFQI